MWLSGRKRTYLAVGAAVLLAGGGVAAYQAMTETCRDVIAAEAAKQIDEGAGETAGEEAELAACKVPSPIGADDWFGRQRASGPQRDLSAATSRAQVQARAIAASHHQLAAANWENLGPANMGGRITDIAVDPTRADTVYAASANGGVWRSTDGGSSFSYSWNPQWPQVVGALAVAGDGTLYAGTGEANPGGGAVNFPGFGMAKSTDGGTTWQQIGLAGTDRIARIAVDPADPRRVFVAAAGPLYQDSDQRGLFLTTDGGATWRKVLAGANGFTGAADVALTPGDPKTIYAAMWEHKKVPEGRPFGGVGSGIFRSTDSGASWTRLAGGLPAAGTGVGRMAVSVTPSDPHRLYAYAAKTTGELLGFWTSTDRGTSWKSIGSTSSPSSSQSSYGWWFGRIFVDPKDPAHLWLPGVPMLESTNGGGSWSSGSGFHSDQHAVAFDPRVAGRVFIGNDGGVYRSTSNGSMSSSWTRAKNLANMQFYVIAVSQQDPSRISGGLQDNGSVRSWGGGGWNSYNGGDGMTNMIDPTDQNKVYSCSQYGACSRSSNGGSSMSSFGSTASSRYNWVSPIAFDPSKPSTMYFGGNKLERSTDSAASWKAISGDLSHGGAGGEHYGTITTIAVAKTDGKVIYCGTDDGRMWITRDTGGTWTEITAGLAQRYITHVTVDPTSAEIAYVTVSGFDAGDKSAHIFRTADGGKSWRSISGNLPNAPVNDVVLDPRKPSALYAATDVGVFDSVDGGVTWSTVGAGLPMVPVMDLETSVAGGATQLTAGTFGLGIYRVNV